MNKEQKNKLIRLNNSITTAYAKLQNGFVRKDIEEIVKLEAEREQLFQEKQVIDIDEEMHERQERDAEMYIAMYEGGL